MYLHQLLNRLLKTKSGLKSGESAAESVASSEASDPVPLLEARRLSKVESKIIVFSLPNGCGPLFSFPLHLVGINPPSSV